MNKKGKTAKVQPDPSTSEKAPEADPTSLQAKAEEAAKQEVTTIIGEHWREVWSTMKDAYVAQSADDAKKFKYDVGLKIRIEPCGGDFKVSAHVAYGIRHKDETEGQRVSNQPELFDGQSGKVEVEALAEMGA